MPAIAEALRGVAKESKSHAGHGTAKLRYHHGPMHDWQPLLQGGLATAALEAVNAIAADLPRAPIVAPVAISPEGAVSWRSSLASGRAGQALFYAYLSFHPSASEGPADLALDLLDQATEGAAAVPMSESLFSGFPGIAWVEEHLQGRLFEAEEDLHLEMDEAILSLLSVSPWPGEYDLINGLVGLGIYALERLPRPSAIQCLERIVGALARGAERGPEGAAWFSPPARISPFKLEVYPKGLYDLGASHGIAGVIALLAGACRAGVHTAVAHPLLDEAVSWLLARELGSERGFRFPHFFHPEVEPRPSRLAWCYGDVGIAAALLFAARAVGEPAWERRALNVALAAVDPGPRDATVKDAGLCHGAAGLGHLFNRMFQATGEERLAGAARSWYEKALAFREPGLGVGGFRSWATDRAGVSDWRNDPGFLEGAAGVGLALLAAASPVEPEWDRLLLVVTPPGDVQYPTGKEINL